MDIDLKQIALLLAKLQEENESLKKEKYSHEKISNDDIKKLVAPGFDPDNLVKIGEDSYILHYTKRKVKRTEQAYIGYARISSQLQRDGFSILAQETSIKNFAKANNGVLKAVYIDWGITGKRTDIRDAFNQMEKDAEEEDIILVMTDSRLGRDTADIEGFKKRMKAKHIYVTVIGNNGTGISNMDSNGQFIGTILTGVATKGGHDISEATEKTMGAMANQKQLKPKTPYGYDSVPDQDNIRKDKHGHLIIKYKLIPNPEQQEAIRDMIKMKNDNPTWSLSKLCRYFDSKPKTFPKRDAKKWYVTTLKAIFTREGIDCGINYILPEYTNREEFNEKYGKDVPEKVAKEETDDEESDEE